MAWLSLPRALLSPKVLLLLLSLSERAALRATLLEILEEYLLLCFEEEEESFLSFTLRPPIVWPPHHSTGLPLIYSFIMLFAGPVVNMNL